MARQFFYIKQDDLRTPLEVILKDAKNIAVNLTAAVSVMFFMRLTTSRVSKVKEELCTIVAPATDGRVRYIWQPGDTDTPGNYRVEFLVDFGDSKPIRFPSRDEDEIEVQIDENKAA